MNINRTYATTQQKGAAYETLASDYLSTQGLQLFQRNFRCRLGEIDLIFHHQNTLVFVEVRSRKNIYFGGAADTVTFKKQRKLIQVAQFFLKMQPHLAHMPCRFDVIAITIQGTNPDIAWIPNAFQMT